MIFRVFPVLLLVLTACSHRLPQKGAGTAYRLIPEVPDDLTKLRKVAGRSGAELDIDFETGRFSGRYRKHDFTGSYAIEHVSAGFVKGFIYRVHMESTEHPRPRNRKEKAFFEHLTGAGRLYAAPDKLRDPAYTVLEISGEGTEDKLLFVKINGSFPVAYSKQ